MNPTEDMKLSIKESFMKENVCVAHYILTSILLPGNINLDIIVKNDIVTLWLITQRFQTNLVEGILLHMNHIKQTQTIGLLYGALITKILVTFRIDPMGEEIASSSNKIDHSFLIK